MNDISGFWFINKPKALNAYNFYFLWYNIFIKLKRRTHFMVQYISITNGELLRRHRVIHRLTQADLAEMLDVTRGTIARWEQMDDLTNTLTMHHATILTKLFKGELNA